MRTISRIVILVVGVLLAAGLAQSEVPGPDNNGPGAPIDPPLPPDFQPSPPPPVNRVINIFCWCPSESLPPGMMLDLPAYKDSIFDSTWEGSMTRYFKDMSYNARTGEVKHRIIGTSVGWSDSIHYVRSDSSWDYYMRVAGGRLWVAQDSFETQIIRKVDQYINFADYDYNQDGNVDCVLFQFAPYAYGNRMDFPSGSCPLKMSDYPTNDGVLIQHYRGAQQWLQTPEAFKSPLKFCIGVTAHEYGHVIGLPDLYDDWDKVHWPEPEAQSASLSGYDRMCGWFTKQPEVIPYEMENTLLSPFCRGHIFNWGSMTTADSIMYRRGIRDYCSTGDMYRLNASTSPLQSFFVSNHQHLKTWENFFPGKGLLIWHYDARPGWINNNEMDKGCDLEVASGLRDTLGSGRGTDTLGAGMDNLDFVTWWQRSPTPALRTRDSLYMVTHGGNLGDSTDFYGSPYGPTVFDGLSNPNSKVHDVYHHWDWRWGDRVYPETLTTHLAVYNIHQDPADSTVMIADLLVNNWYGHLPHGKTTWGDQANVAYRHYVLTGDLTIDEGDTLVIRPATRVDVYPNTDNQQGGWYYDKTEIIVKGTLIVEQEDLPPVQFSSNGEYPGAGDWVGIRAEGDQASVQLAYCTIKDAVQGVCFALGGEGSVTSCTIENMSTSGIEVYSGSNPLLLGNTIHDFGYYGIYVLGGNSRITQNQVTTDRFGDVAYGLVATEGYSGEVDQNVFAFTGWQMWNWSQWGMYLSAVSSEAYFHHNQVYGFGQGGVYVEYSSPYFWCENVHDNMYNGLYCYYYANPTVRHGRYKNHYNGVYATGYSWPNLSAPDTLEGNSFLGYDYHAVNANPGLFALTAENCYWDSVPPNPGKFSGWVDYDPYLNSEPPACSPPGDGGPQDKGGIQLQLPKVYALGPAIPNPSNGQMRIIYQLPKESVVNFRIYNVMGQLVRTLRSGKEKAGYYSATWDGKDAQGKKAGAGVYFYRLDAGEFSKTKKLVIVR